MLQNITIMGLKKEIAKGKYYKVNLRLEAPKINASSR